MTRGGFCTIGCGACCRILGLPALTARPVQIGQSVFVRLAANITPEGRYFLHTRGVTIEGKPGHYALRVPVTFTKGANEPLWWGDAQMAWFRSTCPQLQGDGMCALYGQPERPRTCVEWPHVSENIVTVPECTYTFAEEPTAEGGC